MERRNDSNENRRRRRQRRIAKAFLVRPEPQPEPGPLDKLADFTQGSGAMALPQVAIKQRWPVTQQIMQRVVDAADGIVDSDAAHPLVKVAAMKVLLLADQANVKREANEIEEHHNEAVEAIQGFKVAMASKQVRDAMVGLADAACIEHKPVIGTYPLNGKQ